MKIIGEMFMMMISVMVKSPYNSIISLRRGAMVLAVSLRPYDPLNQTQEGCLNEMLMLRSLVEKNGRGTMMPIGVLLLLRRHSRTLMKVWTSPVPNLP